LLSDIGYARFEKVFFKSLVPQLTETVDLSQLATTARKKESISRPPSNYTNHYDKDTITHAWLWPRISSFLQPSDIVITDTGTSYVGYWESVLPKDVQIINQILWSSIGYGVGAAQGAALAAKEESRQQRTICFEGDGMTDLLLSSIWGTS
jgi:pyruvate decarboxylase